MEKRTETGLVMGHAYGVTAVKKVTSTFYRMVIGYSWSSSSSFEVLFTMMVNNTSKEEYNLFSHAVVILMSVDCNISTQYCQSSSGNEVEQINVIHMLLCSVVIGWHSTAVISASYGSGSLWSVAALLSCCCVF